MIPKREGAARGGHYVATGYQMIRHIEIKNFRCYKQLTLDKCSRINVIVGDNGSGKTSLLEAIFLPLATGPEVAARFRQQRGNDAIFSAPPRRIEEGLWQSLFHNNDMNSAVHVALQGEGSETRSLTIARGAQESFVIPLGPGKESDRALAAESNAPVNFSWRNSIGQVRTVQPIVRQGSIEFPDTGEDMADFFYIAATSVIGSAENAQRFANLRRENRHLEFIDLIREEFDMVGDILIDVVAGAPILSAKVHGNGPSVALPNISGGINRTIAMLLAIAHRERSIVLIDEIENGLYYRHLPHIWRSIIHLSRKVDAQIFVSTHSIECLRALVSVANDLRDIAVWQTERVEGRNQVYELTGEQLAASLRAGMEVR